MKLQNFTLAAAILVMGGCSSNQVIPQADDVKFSKEDPPKECQEIGKVTGQTTYVGGTTDEAIKDMKSDAARKGGNFVKFAELSGTGSVVTGIAFKCP